MRAIVQGIEIEEWKSYWLPRIGEFVTIDEIRSLGYVWVRFMNGTEDLIDSRELDPRYGQPK